MSNKGEGEQHQHCQLRRHQEDCVGFPTARTKSQPSNKVATDPPTTEDIQLTSTIKIKMMDTEHGMTFETLKVHPTALLLFMLLKADKINGVNVLLAAKVKRMNAGSVQKMYAT